MRILLFIVLGLWAITCTQQTYAQKNELTMEDIYLKYSSKLSPSSLKQLQWLKGTDKFMYESGNVILTADARTNTTNDLITIEKLNSILGSAFKTFPSYEVINNQQLLVFNQKKYSLIDLVNAKLLQQINLPENALNETIEKKSFSLAYTKDSNLYVMADGRSHQVTTDGGKGIAYGTAVHRNEFGITNGIFWAPGGSALAFYRMDERMVTDYPLVDVTTRIATLKTIKYPMAGMVSHQVKIGVYDVKSSSLKFLKIEGPADQYLTNIAWSPDAKFIFVAVLNREQNHMWLNQYEANTGNFVRTLFEETDPHYVEPLHPMVFIGDNASQFLWQSRRDGFNHLYLYSSDGKLIKQLTSGNWEVLNVINTPLSSGDLFFEANISSPLERQLCKVNLKTGKLVQVTKVSGLHRCQISTNGNYFLDNYNSSSIPAATDLWTSDGKLIRQLFLSENPLKNFNLGESTKSSILADDGKTRLFYRLVKPVNFDPNKKYPVIIYVYGGPHEQLVLNQWPNRTELWQQYMAQKGYVSFTIDNRGSENRGRDFEAIIHRQLGHIEIKDQMAGVAFLKTLSFVDSSRIGVHGWSFGGFMTTSLMIKHPETFKVGVAGGPVIDWKYYEVMYGERYMDTPQENPDGYANSGLLDKTNQLKGKLLIIHGGQDPTVVWQNSLMFIENCIKNNKPIDYFVYPTHEHNVIGKDRLHLMQKVSDYFFNFL